MPDDQLRVATLNAASLLEPGWETRRHETVAWLDHLDADIVCLQEVWESPGTPNTAGWLADASARDWHWVFGGLPFPEEMWSDPTVLFGSAVLSRWPIEQSELVALPVDDRPDPPHPVYRFNAELLHARTAGIDVFSTHLAPPPAQAYHRVRQARCIDETVRRLGAPDAALPPVICGDFNAEPDSDEIRFLASLATIDGTSTYYQDAWRAAGHTEPGFTWDGRVNPLANHLHLPPKRLDYVFVGDPFGRPQGSGLVERADLAFHEPRTGILASDHFGLVVDIRWPQRPDRADPSP